MASPEKKAKPATIGGGDAKTSSKKLKSATALSKMSNDTRRVDSGTSTPLIKDIIKNNNEIEGQSPEVRTSKNQKKDEGGGGDADDFDAWMKSRQLLKPEDQLDLTEAELTEEITKVLTPTNTNVIKNLVVYSFKDGEFIPVPLAPNTVELLSFAGSALHIDSEEAKIQLEESDDIGYPVPAPKYSIIDTEPRETLEGMGEEEGEEGEDGDDKKTGGLDKQIEEGDEEEAEEEEEEAKADEAPAEDEGAAADDDEHRDEGAAPAAQAHGKKRKLINQFNYCERAALTFTNPKRSVDTQTIPPPRSQYGANVLQWVIYDSYLADFQEQHKDQSKSKDDRRGNRPRKDKRSQNRNADAEKLNSKYLKCWQILERMINQNIFDDIANDYRYWEDPADEYRESEGTLLPLWKFHYEKTKKMVVTDIIFNPSYYDLFAVCYGSHDFMKQLNEGYLCLFTVKNPSYPDYIIQTESGVMCVDIHKKYPFLVAIGLYDGNVAVYNLRDTCRKPLYVSSNMKSKHSECIWNIKWGQDMADGELNFFTVSSDGRVFNWILMQNGITVTTMLSLYIENGIADGPDGTKVHFKSCGTCLVFHPADPEIYIIGTEDGYIFKCSTAFSSKYLMTYHAHHLSVYRIDFNHFNSNIFASCSADWRIKIWEDMRPEPLFVFDLGSVVGCVKWAPYSSTVFAGVTTEGKVHVFDLNVNKYRAICIQAVVPKLKNKLTRLVFNDKLPMILVGDEKGSVHSLKLSPNLRIMVKPPKKQLYLDQTTLQISKLEKLLSLVRELPEGVVIAETATTVQS